MFGIILAVLIGLCIFSAGGALIGFFVSLIGQLFGLIGYCLKCLLEPLFYGFCALCALARMKIKETIQGFKTKQSSKKI